MHFTRNAFRAVFLGGFLVCAGLIAFALYAQYRLGMNPCPLCILQRVAFIALGLVFLVGGLWAPRGSARKLLALLVTLIALVGIAIAMRHLWIQSLPPGTISSCGAPLGYLLETRHAHGGLWGVLRMVLSGSGECAQVEYVLGLPIPLWSLAWFVLLGAAGGLTGWRSR